MYKPIRRADLIIGGTAVKQGEIFTLGFQLFDANGLVIVPTVGQSLSVKVANKTGVVFETVASVVDDHIEFTIDENIGAGKMRVELTVGDGVNVLQKYPANGYIELLISASLDDIGTGTIYTVTAAEMFERIEGSEVASAEAVANAIEAKGTADAVRADFDLVVAEAGSSNPEVVLARGGEANLNARLSGVDSQLADTAKKTAKNAFYAEVNSHRYRKPMITIIDDDGRPKLWTDFKPVIERQQVPITAAIITNRVGDDLLSVNLTQMKEMQKLGVEFVNHTTDHSDLLTLATDAEIESKLKPAQEWLNNNGFNGDYIVYPFGGVNANIKKIARKFSRAGIDISRGTNTGINYPPLDTYSLVRTDFETNSITALKAKVDEAITNNGWLIIMSHTGYESWTASKMEELIVYAKTKAIQFVTLENGMNQVGNILDTGDILVGGNGIIIDADGEAHGNNIGVTRIIVTTSLTNTTSITNFKKSTVSIGYLLDGVASSGGFPTLNGGVLETHRFANDAFSYQVYKPYASFNVYRRKWNTTTSLWNAWVNENFVQLRANNTYSSTTAPSAIPAPDRETINVARVDSGGATGFPENSAGTLYFNPIASTGYVHQIYVLHGSGRMYKRAYDNSAWTAWSRIDAPSVTKDASGTVVGVVNANSSKDVSVNSGAFALGDTLVTNPYSDLPAGIIYNSWVSSAGVAKIRVFNMTGASIDLGTMRWIVKAMKNDVTV